MRGSPRMSMVLPMRMVEKPWGRTSLPPPFTAPTGKRIGEIWFEPPPELNALLVKYIFTSDKLSIQVHPSDAQTLAHGLGRQGKEECWLILDAEPGAHLGVGLNVVLDAPALEAAALDGSIERHLEWHPVSKGDFFYIPANTVHAIGAGISLIEVQQNSDITYRLYDYGRPRELHLHQGISVARGEPYDERCHRRIPEHGEIQLVNGPQFRLIRYDGPLSSEANRDFDKAPLLVMPAQGDVIVNGKTVSPGACAEISTLDDLIIRRGSKGLIAQPVTH